MADLDSLPLWLNVNATYQPQDFRQLIDAIFAEGVLTGGAVSERGAGANMSVDVSAIKAIVQGDSIALQGKYLAWEDSVKNVTVGAAPGSNSRLDILVLRIYDATATGSGADKAALEIVEGTAAASPVIPSIPASALHLATIGPILTSTTSITNAMITDTRTYSTLAFALVNTAAIIDGAITSAKIATGTIVAADIANDTITATQIAPDAITASELADNAVDTNAILNLSVTESKLAANSVTSAKIAADAVGAQEIEAGAVGTAELADGAVTQPKVTTTWTLIDSSGGANHVEWMKLGTTVFVNAWGSIASGQNITLPVGARPKRSTSSGPMGITSGGVVDGWNANNCYTWVYEAA